MDIQKAKKLLEKYREGNCNADERAFVEQYYQQLVASGNFEWKEREKELTESMLEGRISQHIDGNNARLRESEARTKSPVFFLKRSAWMAAASIIFAAGFFGYLFLQKKNNQQRQTANTSFTNIKAPQSSRAMITLDNGQKIFLDSAGKGSLAVQGNVNLLKTSDGTIAYQAWSNVGTGKLQYNTLSNPRGSKVISMVLSDGSKVWLNVASSLTFQVAFVGTERKVSITGEAYFEVKHDAVKPFIVSNGSMNVRVLGTHFNVNAFEDDGDDIKVTLLQGAVKINNGTASGLLKPGQQAIVSKAITINDDVDVDKVMGWKNGYFEFDNATLSEVLKEIGRWYDVDVVFDPQVQPKKFMGEIQRDLSLGEVLKILEKSNVHFRMEGKKLFVTTN